MVQMSASTLIFPVSIKSLGFIEYKSRVQKEIHDSHSYKKNATQITHPKDTNSRQQSTMVSKKLLSAVNNG